MFALTLVVLITSIAQTDEPLFVAKTLTKPKEFTSGIEGPACDAAGNIFAGNFAKQGTIGRITPDGKGRKRLL
mgnify:CR=1 FL=1